MSTSVLIIESEPWLGDHYESILRKEGFCVDRASHAYAAMDMVDKKMPSAIVMSLLLSGTSGIGLLHELQTYVDTSQIPIVVYGRYTDITLEDLEPYGVRRFLDSAIMRPEDVVAAVRSVALGTL
ncbi:response regulator [Candidatus Saccharibacteria bacterium]|nr:response regulator [Candidatus Saccharibacteria bacterium]